MDLCFSWVSCHSESCKVNACQDEERRRKEIQVALWRWSFLILIFYHLSDPTTFSWDSYWLWATTSLWKMPLCSKGTGLTAALSVSGRNSPLCSTGWQRLQQKRQGGLCFSPYIPQLKLSCPPPAFPWHLYYCILRGSSRIRTVAPKKGLQTWIMGLKIGVVNKFQELTLEKRNLTQKHKCKTACVLPKDVMDEFTHHKRSISTSEGITANKLMW